MARAKDTSGVEAKATFLPKEASVKLLHHKAGAIVGYEKIPQAYDPQDLITQFQQNNTPANTPSPRPPEPSQRKAGERFGPLILPETVKQKYDTHPMGSLDKPATEQAKHRLSHLFEARDIDLVDVLETLRERPAEPVEKAPIVSLDTEVLERPWFEENTAENTETEPQTAQTQKQVQPDAKPAEPTPEAAETLALAEQYLKEEQPHTTSAQITLPVRSAWPRWFLGLVVAGLFSVLIGALVTKERSHERREAERPRGESSGVVRAKAVEAKAGEVTELDSQPEAETDAEVESKSETEGESGTPHTRAAPMLRKGVVKPASNKTITTDEMGAGLDERAAAESLGQTKVNSYAEDGENAGKQGHSEASLAAEKLPTRSDLQANEPSKAPPKEAQELILGEW